MNRVFEGIGRLIGYAILLAETLSSRGELADAPTLDQHCDADPVRMVAPHYPNRTGAMSRHIRRHRRNLLWQRLNQTYYPAHAYRSVEDALSTETERKFASDVERWLRAWEDTR